MINEQYQEDDTDSDEPGYCSIGRKLPKTAINLCESDVSITDENTYNDLKTKPKLESPTTNIKPYGEGKIKI